MIEKFRRFLPAHGNVMGLMNTQGGAAVLHILRTARLREKASASVRDGSNGLVEASTLRALDGRSMRVPAQEGTWGPAHLERHHWRMALALVAVVVMLTLVALFAILRAERLASRLGSTAQSQMQSQRLAKAVPQAMGGHANAFRELRESADDLSRHVHGLAQGHAGFGMARVESEFDAQLFWIVQLVERADVNVKVVLDQQQILMQTDKVLRVISRQSFELVDMVGTVTSLKMQQGASLPEVSATSQLLLLTQRIGKTVNELLAPGGLNSDAMLMLEKDLGLFRESVHGLLEGNTSQNLPGTRDVQTRQHLEAILKIHAKAQGEVGKVLDNLPGLIAARQAQASILVDSEPLRIALDDLQDRLAARTGLDFGIAMLLAALLLMALGLAARMVYLQMREGRERAVATERERQEAQARREAADRVNATNEAAILRLMNELQAVAEGDLMREAMVTEDITGALADAVNYALEELRRWIVQVQGIAARMVDSTAQVEGGATALLDASTEQSRKIQKAGRSVLTMAERIHSVSSQTQASVKGVRESLDAALSGLRTVRDAMGGMNLVRDRIQDAPRRIQRMDASSQEIGEIAELMSDITEQSHILALNAAIQAASTGESGRGFSVVVEEMQRLAERSASLTRQIPALVKAIQTDVRDVCAMERAAREVIEGAGLSGSVEEGLSDIDSVSRQLALLIEQLSTSILCEAHSADEVAVNMQHVCAVAEKTNGGTRAIAQQARELSGMAEELRESVARFKLD